MLFGWLGLGKCAKSSDGGKTITEYNAYFREDDKTEDAAIARHKSYATMINHYYNIVTDFYEYGWGDSFHFAPRGATESFIESIRRHEHYLALRLQARPGMRIVDLGCGVGGPMRQIARFSGCDIIGVNNNDYQIQRARYHTSLQGPSLAKHLTYMVADFHKLDIPDNSLDGAYTIEASCHSPDRVQLFREILRVLKPGAAFAGYEWVMTPRYNPDDAEHRRIKHGVMAGDGLPDIAPSSFIAECLQEAGFEVEETTDLAETGDIGVDIPWYQPLDAKISLEGFKHTIMGRSIASCALYSLETAHLVPKGTYATQTMLVRAADSLVAGGKLRIFTPMFFFIARKPASKFE